MTVFETKSVIILKKELLFSSNKFYKKKKKIRSYSNEVLQIFTIKKYLNQARIILAVILIDFPLKKDGNYYLQEFLNESKYIEEEIKVIRHITDELNFLLIMDN